MHKPLQYYNTSQDAFSVIYPNTVPDKKLHCRLMLVPEFECVNGSHLTDAAIEIILKNGHTRNVNCVRLDTDSGRSRMCMIRNRAISADGIPLLFNSRRDLDSIAGVRFLWKTENDGLVQYYAVICSMEFSKGLNFSLDNSAIIAKDDDLPSVGDFDGIFHLGRTGAGNTFCITLKDSYRTGCHISSDGNIFYGPEATNIYKLPECSEPYTLTLYYTQCILHDPLFL